MLSHWLNAFNCLEKQGPQYYSISVEQVIHASFHMSCSSSHHYYLYLNDNLRLSFHPSSHIYHWLMTLMDYFDTQSCKDPTLIQASEMAFSYLMADLMTSKTRITQSLSLFSWFPEELQKAEQETLLCLLIREDLINLSCWLLSTGSGGSPNLICKLLKNL